VSVHQRYRLPSNAKTKDHLFTAEERRCEAVEAQLAADVFVASSCCVVIVARYSQTLLALGAKVAKRLAGRDCLLPVEQVDPVTQERFCSGGVLRAGLGGDREVGGADGGRASVVGALLVDGRLSLASTLSEQPLSSVVPIRRAATAHRRSRTAGGYAGPRLVLTGTVDIVGSRRRIG
jgi:hypothetical protein